MTAVPLDPGDSFDPPPIPRGGITAQEALENLRVLFGLRRRPVGEAPGSEG